jgi:hypothetical protein
MLQFAENRTRFAWLPVSMGMPVGLLQVWDTGRESPPRAWAEGKKACGPAETRFQALRIALHLPQARLCDLATTHCNYLRIDSFRTK